MNMELIVAVVSGVGSLLIASVVGVLGFFLRRYIKHQDEKNIQFFQGLHRLETISTETNTILLKQDFSCESKMKHVGDVILHQHDRLTKVETTVEEHIKEHYSPKKKGAKA